MESQEKNLLIALAAAFAAWALASCAPERAPRPRSCPVVCYTDSSGELECHVCEKKLEEDPAGVKDDRPEIKYESDDE
jgi:hypothetical protein